MIVDNKETVIRDRKMQYLLPVGLLVIICALMFTNIMVEPVYGITRGHVIALLIMVYIVVNVFFYVKNYNYIFCNILDGKLVIRYYSLKPFMFNPKNQMIEIPIDTFLKYEIKKSKFGIKEELYLYQKLKSKTAKYPPISLTALTSNEKEGLIQALNSL